MRFCGPKSWLTNGVLRRIVALALLAAVLAGGCGGGSGRREDVASYVESVNSIELSMRRLDREYRSCSGRNCVTPNARPRGMIVTL